MAAVRDGMLYSVMTECDMVSINETEWYTFVINQIKVKASQSIFITKCYFNSRSALWSIRQPDLEPNSSRHAAYNCKSDQIQPRDFRRHIKLLYRYGLFVYLGHGAAFTNMV